MPLTIDESVSLLKKGNIICVETDTILGLAADPHNKKSLQNLYKIKGRSTIKKFVWMVHSLKQVEELCDVPHHAQWIAKRYWPGNLTLVLPLKQTPEKTQAFRIPNHPTLLTLLQKWNQPLAVTSVNKSGQNPIFHFEKIPTTMRSKIAGILQGSGSPQNGEPSTIVKILQDEKIQILREGAIKLIDLSSSSS